MYKALKLAKREYMASVRTRGFIISLVLLPVLMSGGMIAMALLEDHGDTTDQRVAIVDHSGLVGNAVAEAAKAFGCGCPQELVNDDGEFSAEATCALCTALARLDPGDGGGACTPPSGSTGSSVRTYSLARYATASIWSTSTV